jgi:hypothetical protein
MRLCGRAPVLYDPRKLKVACVYSWAQATKVCSGNSISKLTAVAPLNVRQLRKLFGSRTNSPRCAKNLTMKQWQSIGHAINMVRMMVRDAQVGKYETALLYIISNGFAKDGSITHAWV